MDDTTPTIDAAAKRKFIIRSKAVIDLPNGVTLIPSTETEDAIKAHQCMEFGCTVIDAATGKEAWPKQEAK